MKNKPGRFVLLSSFLAFVFFLAGHDGQAATRRVPADYPTIQQAINAAVDGDTVLAAAGTYVENINFLGKAITVTSESGAQATVVDGNRNGSPVVTINSHEGPQSVLRGFTIRNGRSADGGGILIRVASPTIEHNIVTDNAASAGGGIAIIFASPIIQSNVITKNRAGAGGGIGGGGISILVGNPRILNNVISENALLAAAGGGISIFGSDDAVILGNLIENNIGFSQGGGIWIVNCSNASIVQNTIVGNEAATAFETNLGGAGEGGGIAWLVPNGGGSPRIINNTIADNKGLRCSGFFLQGFKARTQIEGNIIMGKEGQTAFFVTQIFDPTPPIFKFNDAFSPQGIAWGGDLPSQIGINGNISADPQFVHPSTGNYHLQLSSPCIDAGDNAAPDLPATDIDEDARILDGNRDGAAVVDMGVDEVLRSFDRCIQDDSSGIVLKINSSTGEYEFANCSGIIVGGSGTLTRMGCLIVLQHYAGDKRVLARIDTCQNKATASVQILSQGRTFTISDRDTRNDTCACR